jgi:hypothetical protein
MELRMITVDGRLRRLEQRNRALWCALGVAVVGNFGAIGAAWFWLPQAAAPTPVVVRPQPLATAQETPPAPQRAPEPPARPAPTTPDRLVATAIDLVDDAGVARARIRIDPNSGSGLFESLDANGAALATLGPGSLRLTDAGQRSAATLDAGRLRLAGDVTSGAFEVRRSEAGQVALTLEDLDGGPAILLESGPAGARFVAHRDGAPWAMIEGGELTLTGDGGASRFVAGSLEFAGADAAVGVTLDAHDRGGRLELANASGEIVARLGAGDTGDGELETFDRAGRRLASIVATAEGQGGLFAFNALGNLAMQLAADESGDGVLRVNNRLGQSRFILTTGQRDEASMYTVDVRGRLVPVLGAEAAARRAGADDEASR